MRRSAGRRAWASGDTKTPSGDASGLQLMVFSTRAAGRHALPSRGTVSIGRADGCDVRIDDPSVSRRHAVLHIDPRVSIRDEGSANGTWVHARADGQDTAPLSDVRLEPGRAVDLAVGDSFTVGSVLVTLCGPDAPGDGDVIVRDAVMFRLHETARRVATSPISVLLLGDTGVGKEVLADVIHRASPRAAGPFVRLNCAALAEHLLESELFGHEKGAFTGAAGEKPGLLEVARGGTVFLDEIGELPLAMQAKLLRVIEEREVLRVGGLAPRPIDVRFVAATHRDLAAAVERGAFRRDLYFRLNGISLVIPPLRERVGEIRELAARFAARAAERMGRAHAPALSPEALSALEAHDWPGNIRELRNVIERAAVLCADGVILPEHLGLEARAVATAVAPAAAPATPASEPARAEGGEDTREGLRSELDAVERRRIEDALAACAGNQTEAAARLGISRRTLINRIERYGISRPRKGR